MVPSKEWLDWASLIGGLGSGIAGVGAVAAFWQLRLLKTQSVTSFEDGLVDEYRDIAKELPLDALLGVDMSPQDVANALPAFYRYFDFCNQQLFLHQQGRIRKATWALWRDGIVSNLRRPAFARAWAEIAAKAIGDFDELRALCPPKATEQRETA
jgi:hypothetical protein